MGLTYAPKAHTARYLAIGLRSIRSVSAYLALRRSIGTSTRLDTASVGALPAIRAPDILFPQIHRLYNAAFGKERDGHADDLLKSLGEQLRAVGLVVDLLDGKG